MDGAVTAASCRATYGTSPASRIDGSPEEIALRSRGSGYQANLAATHSRNDRYDFDSPWLRGTLNPSDDTVAAADVPGGPGRVDRVNNLVLGGEGRLVHDFQLCPLARMFRVYRYHALLQTDVRVSES
ncbi:hypothetical protein Bbelb_212770 [Branchiostoma belcheri]|nr:hypothetical protein Bbelb_212770 [Branchiostoma belcheri]